MSDREYIESLVKGADLYRKQGLPKEAREKYVEALSYVSEHRDIGNHPKLIELIQKRIRLVDEGLADIRNPEKAPDLPRNVQDLVKSLFSFSGTGEGSSLEGAVALMRFGQYKRALEEFEALFAKGVQPLLAARNIITCLLLFASPEKAVERYGEWRSEDTFSCSELLNLRYFLQSALRERGIRTELPYPVRRSTMDGPAKNKQEDRPDISSVVIESGDGLLRDRTELKVSFQFGNVISVMISSSRRDLTELLKPGVRLRRMEFYSPMAFFRGTGRIAGRNLIKQGPRKGDYLFDIAIDEE